MRTELLASRLGTLPFAALREDGDLAELFLDVAPVGERLGQILRARVSRVMPELGAAFVHLGGRRGALLHAEDLVLPGEPSRSKRPIAERLSPGRELVVQVTREPLPGKGARVSCRLALTGRFLVLLGADRGRRISRRIVEPEVRTALATRLERLPGETGWLARTAAAHAPEDAVREEAEALLRRWREILDDAEGGAVPRAIGSVPGPLERALRDLSHDSLTRVVVDDERDRDLARRMLDVRRPSGAVTVEWHQGPAPLPCASGLDREIERLLRERVWLPCGGRVTIEETEAMISVDVDSGKFRGRGDREASALRVDLEAATVVARELRARGHGGIVAIDFIDLERSENRERLLDALGNALARDRARTRVFGFHEPGLVLLTRERPRIGAVAALTRGCPDCGGSGRTKLPPLVAAGALGDLARRGALGDRAGEWTVTGHPDVLAEIRAAAGETARPWRFEPRSEWGFERIEIAAPGDETERGPEVARRPGL